MTKAERVFYKCVLCKKYSLAVKIAEKHNLTEENETVSFLKRMQKSHKRDYFLVLFSSFFNGFLFALNGYSLYQKVSVKNICLFALVLVLLFINYKTFKLHNKFKMKMGL